MVSRSAPSRLTARKYAETLSESIPDARRRQSVIIVQVDNQKARSWSTAEWELGYM